MAKGADVVLSGSRAVYLLPLGLPCCFSSPGQPFNLERPRMKRCATVLALLFLASKLYAANPVNTPPPAPQLVGQPCADNEETCGYPFGLPTDPGGDGTGAGWSCQACMFENNLLMCRQLVMYQTPSTGAWCRAAIRRARPTITSTRTRGSVTPAIRQWTGRATSATTCRG